MNRRGLVNRYGCVEQIEPSKGRSDSVNQKRQDNQDSVTTLVEVSEPGCRVKSGQMTLKIGDTQRTEITTGTNPLRYPEE